jgi:RNA polymerase sigma-70 factor (ECF subfamily)
LALKEAWQLLDELLAKLPEKLRRVMVLAEVEGLEVSEVAQFEGIPVGTAASRLRLGRERFRALLAKHAARNPWGGES